MHDSLLEQQHLWGFVDAAIKRSGEHPLWVQRLAKDKKRTVSYRTIKRRAVAISRQLREAGVGEGDRVAILAPNGPDWGAAAFAVWRLGAVVAPLHTGNSDEELQTQHTALAPICTLYAGNDRSLAGAEAITGEEENEGDDTTPEPDPHSEAARIYTSGTTGNPKIVRLSHDNILSNLRGTARLDIPISHKDRFLSLLPLSHAMELTGGMLLPMYHGSTIVVPRLIAASEILEAMDQERITLMIAVPRLFRNIMLGMERKFSDGSAVLKAYVTLIRRSPNWLSKIINAPIRRKLGGGIQCWLSGGSRLDPEIARYFRDMGFPLIQGYGLTECGPVVSVQSLRDIRLDSVGVPLHGMEVKIQQPNETGDGELWVRGSNLMLGYVDDEQNAEAMHDGWYKTGDIARLVEGRKIVLTGRSKRLIVTEAGKNVYPEDVEIMLEKHPLLKEAGVIELDMAPAAVLAIEGPDEIDKAREIIKDYNRRASSHNRITRYAFVDELPRTPLGKISLKDLPRIFRENEVT
ncbi:MAG: Long-chain-fatty-acid--CoA ligase FadD15 [Gammaproteobacteria bacterium]|nr:Long-chain-fatty-acid--CoA ligase FadD15 [Gammaproteobacteria bacterium]